MRSGKVTPTVDSPQGPVKVGDIPSGGDPEHKLIEQT
jgi:hypothetical protein